MNTIYIIRPSYCFKLIPNSTTRFIPDNYDEIASLVLSYSGKTNINADNNLMSIVTRYSRFQPHRLLTAFWSDAINDVGEKKLIMWEGNLPPINAKHFFYAMVTIAKGWCLILDTANRRVFLPDGRILPENKAQEWHAQIEEMMAFGQQQMDLGFPQSNPLIKKYFIEQLSPQLTDLGFVVSTHEPDIVFSHSKHYYQLNIGLDGECGMYEIFADLIFHQATEQIAQVFNQPFTGSELTVSVNQLINWQLPVDYRSIRSFEDVARFISGFNQQLVPLLKQISLYTA